MLDIFIRKDRRTDGHVRSRRTYCKLLQDIAPAVRAHLLLENPMFRSH